LLRRQYRDRTVVVKILCDGFEYEGRRYGSLSAVARAATGTRWNAFTRRSRQSADNPAAKSPATPSCEVPAGLALSLASLPFSY
jgi:hypothetical protein